MATDIPMEKVGDVLTRLASAAVGPEVYQVALPQMMAVAYHGVRRHFAQSRGPDGRPWKVTKDGGKPLVKSGFLLGSVRTRKAGPLGFVLEATARYAGIHQRGGTVHKPARSRSHPWVFTVADGTVIFTRRIRAHNVTIPARPFLGFSKETLSRMGEVLEAEAVRQAQRVATGGR